MAAFEDDFDGTIINPFLHRKRPDRPKYSVINNTEIVSFPNGTRAMYPLGTSAKGEFLDATGGPNWSKVLEFQNNEGTRYFMRNGKVHRDLDKPAVVHMNGHMEWLNDGKLHRENGPAVIFANGKQLYFTNGKEWHAEGVRAHVQNAKQAAAARKAAAAARHAAETAKHATIRW